MALPRSCQTGLEANQARGCGGTFLFSKGKSFEWAEGYSNITSCKTEIVSKNVPASSWYIAQQVYSQEPIWPMKMIIIRAFIECPTMLRFYCGF